MAPTRLLARVLARVPGALPPAVVHLDAELAMRRAATINVHAAVDAGARVRAVPLAGVAAWVNVLVPARVQGRAAVLTSPARVALARVCVVAVLAHAVAARHALALICTFAVDGEPFASRVIKLAALTMVVRRVPGARACLLRVGAEEALVFRMAARVEDHGAPGGVHMARWRAGVVENHRRSGRNQGKNDRMPHCCGNGRKQTRQPTPACSKVRRLANNNADRDNRETTSREGRSSYSEREREIE